MGRWDFEHSAESPASPGEIWERYTDVEGWHEWSKGVDRSSLEGAFEAETKGNIKPRHLPEGRFELTAVEPERRFTSEVTFVGATLRLEHEIEPSNGGSRITHRAIFEGPLEFVWRPLVRMASPTVLTDGVERLAELAVEKEEEARELAKEKEERKARLHESNKALKEEIKKTAPKEGRDPGAPSLPGSDA